MLVDFHTHAFADAIVEKAMATLVKNAGNTEPVFDGRLSALTDYLRRNGVDYAVVCNIATNPRQQKKVNDFAIAANGGPIVSFGSVHPDAPDALEELCRIKEAGLKGIKLHPDYQQFFVDAEKLFPIYEKAGELGLITVLHAGVDIGYFEPVHCTPERLSHVLDIFQAPVVAAHMGGFLQWDEVERHLVGKKVYLDTAFTYSCMPRGQAMRIVKNHGVDRILLGSDMPWCSTMHQVRFIQSWDLPAKEEAAVLGGSAARLLGL